jgi:nucleotide-binding universal stress UspA family protein
MDTSPFRRIVVHLDDTAPSGKRIALGMRIARDWGASLCVTYSTLPGYTLVIDGPDAASSAVQVLREFDDDRMRAARTRFDRDTAGAQPPADWAACCEMPIETDFVVQSLYADLLVLGQHDASDPQAGWVPSDFAEYVVAASGKPAIVVPHSMPLPAGFGTVLIAWKETREAARAVAAALPFLARARRVVAVSWGEDETVARPGLVRLAQHLRGHGVELERRYEGPQDGDTGEMLLSRAADLGAELLVMGCYGHRRARELALGGVSRTVLRSMTLPVLLAH